MNKTKILFFIPVFILLGWVLFLQSMVSSGVKIELPIRGYDPRDILAGHYLSVEVDFDAFAQECKVEGKENARLRWKKRDAFFCVPLSKVFLEKPSNCGAFIKGYCQNNDFHGNISRFYIPEKSSRVLERAVLNQENNPMLSVSVAKDGKAYPLDLILQGMPFKEWLKFNRLNK